MEGWASLTKTARSNALHKHHATLQERVACLEQSLLDAADKHQGLDQAMLFARCARGACRPIRIHAEMMDVAVHLPKALRATKVCPNQVRALPRLENRYWRLSSSPKLRAAKRGNFVHLLKQ